MKQKCGSGHIKVQGHAFRFYSWPSMLHWKAMHNSMHGLQEPFWVKQKSKKTHQKRPCMSWSCKAENPQLYEFCNVYTPPAFHLDNQRGAQTVILGPFPNNIINWNKMIYVCYNSSNDLRKFGFCRKYFKYSKFSTIMSLGSASSMVECLTAMWGIAGSSPGRCLNAFLHSSWYL